MNGRPGSGSAEGEEGEEEKVVVMSLDEVNAVRMREITAKGVSGILLLLLKWFKISRKSVESVVIDQNLTSRADVLKFEFLTQLLLDSNYLPLILKLFAHQDLDKAVELKIDREDLR